MRRRLRPDRLSIVAATVVVLVFWLPPVLDGVTPLGAAAGTALAVAVGVAIVLRWRRPGAATIVAGIATIAGHALAVCEDPLLAMAWCLYPLAVARAAQARLPVLGGAGVLVCLAAVTAVPAGPAGLRIVVAIAALSASWLLGTMVGRETAAERARVQLEVARDVHDVVGHALAVISAEAGVTRALPDAAEPELRDSLGGIERHARRALEEVQVLVRGLRSAPADRLPGPVSGLSALVASTRAAGVEVEARILVDERTVDAVTLRIVQESLSNVVRHAAGAPCTVDVYETGAETVVRVRDRGPGAREPGRSGHGLTGMRERAQLAGGTVSWGDHPDGGFEVSARLPGRAARR